MKKYSNPLLKAMTVVALLYIIYYQTSSIKKLQADNNTIRTECDSIKSEMFTKDIQIQRYEYIMDQVDEMPLGCKEEFNKILHETE